MNPFDRSTALSKTFRMRVPTESAARAAYVDGDIELDEFEDLITAAIESREVELSPAMRRRVYTQHQNLVRFHTDAPSTVLYYDPTHGTPQYR